MIDIENIVINKVVEELTNNFENITVSSEETKVPASFPAVLILEKSNNVCLQDYIDFLSILSDVGNIKTRIDFVNKHKNKFSNTKICPFCYKIIKPSQKTWHKTLIKDNLPAFRSFCSSECADKFYIETAIGRTEYENAKQIQFEKDHLRCEIFKNYYQFSH